MTRNFSMRSLFLTVVTFLSLTASVAFAGNVVISPDFRLADRQIETSPEAAELEIICGIAGKLKFCYQFNQRVAVTDIQIVASRLGFTFGIMGSCKNFDAKHLISAPRVEWRGFHTKLYTEEVATPIQMDGQEYCMRSEVRTSVELPAILQAEVLKRDKEGSAGRELVFKLDESSLRDWAPAMQLVITDEFRRAPKVVIRDLDYTSRFASLAQQFRNTRETLTGEFDRRSTPSERAAENVTRLLQEALRGEFAMPLSQEDEAKFTFADKTATKVFMQRIESQPLIKVIWF